LIEIMPTVLTRILITSFWLICTGMLIYRDVLPEYLVGEPPDWKRMVSKTELRPTRWLIAVDEGGEKNRVVGQAFNEIKKRADGGTSFISRVKIDAKGLFQGTPLQVAESTKFHATRLVGSDQSRSSSRRVGRETDSCDSGHADQSKQAGYQVQQFDITVVEFPATDRLCPEGYGQRRA
jgi:hypothetical protein